MAKQKRDPMDPVSLGNRVISAETIGDCTVEATASANGQITYSLHHGGVFHGASRYETTILDAIALINGGMDPHKATARAMRT